MPKDSIVNSFILTIVLYISAMFRRNVHSVAAELDAVSKVAILGSSCNYVIEAMENAGFSCTDASATLAGTKYNSSGVFVCHKKFYERRMLFPTILTVTFLFSENKSLSAFEHTVHRLCL